MTCEWCGKELTDWYLTYKGKKFCRRKEDQCLKDYLYDEADEEIGMEMTGDMSYNEDLARESCAWYEK